MSVDRTAKGPFMLPPSWSLDNCSVARASSSEAGRRIAASMLCQHRRERLKLASTISWSSRPMSTTLQLSWVLITRLACSQGAQTMRAPVIPCLQLRCHVLGLQHTLALTSASV